MKERRLRTHVLYNRFSTLQGFSETYMNDLSTQLRESDIDCEILFVQTLPLGVASLSQIHGFHELFIRKEQVDMADQVIQKFLGQRC